MVNYYYASMNEQELLDLATNLVKEYEDTKFNQYHRVTLADLQKLERNTQRLRYYSEEGVKINQDIRAILERDANIKFSVGSKTAPSEYEIRERIRTQNITPTTLNHRI